MLSEPKNESKWPIWSERNTFWPMLNWRLRKWNVCRVMITCSRRLAKTGCYIFQVMGSNEVAEHQQPKFYPLVNVYKKLWKITMLSMGKSTISMAIFKFANCECLPGRVSCPWKVLKSHGIPLSRLMSSLDRAEVKAPNLDIEARIAPFPNQNWEQKQDWHLGEVRP